MANFLEKCKQNWERSTLWGTLVLCVTLIVVSMLLLFNRESISESGERPSNAKLQPQHLMHPIDRRTLPPQPINDPFRPTLQAPKPAPPPTPKPKPAVKPKPTPKPKPTTKAPEPPLPKPKPAPTFRQAKLQLLYQTVNSAGQTIAIVTVTVSDQPPKTLTLSPGKANEGLTLLSSASTQAEIKDATGKKNVVPVGGTATVAIPQSISALP